MKVSEAQRRASKKWDDSNKERKNYIVKRSSARGFIRNNATLEDLEELEVLMEERRQQLIE